VADEENKVKSAFEEIIKGTPFEDELDACSDRSEIINAVLSDQQSLMSLLKICSDQEM